MHFSIISYVVYEKGPRCKNEMLKSSSRNTIYDSYPAYIVIR